MGLADLLVHLALGGQVWVTLDAPWLGQVVELARAFGCRG